ncbi:MAG TPA: sulfurtransferase-like selenium metabolism protein YedF [Clostridia bacterium]|nr:sulfurtransferase-like selenium metabolism protein YedF [Clostridia bacterium]
MNKQVDARGMNCPLPVIQTKKALEEIEKGIITTIVDNEVAKENVLKLAKSMNLKADVKQSQGDYYIDILKEEQAETTESESSNTRCGAEGKEDSVILITKDTLGDGSDELGALLMSSYLYTLTEILPYPTGIIFLNGGVRLTVEGSESLEHIRTLESNGVEILSCGTCLDYFELNDKLAVGSVSNMYTIVEKLNKISNITTL